MLRLELWKRNLQFPASIEFLQSIDSLLSVEGRSANMAFLYGQVDKNIHIYIIIKFIEKNYTGKQKVPKWLINFSELQILFTGYFRNGWPSTHKGCNMNFHFLTTSLNILTQKKDDFFTKSNQLKITKKTKIIKFTHRNPLVFKCISSCDSPLGVHCQHQIYELLKIYKTTKTV